MNFKCSFLYQTLSLKMFNFFCLLVILSRYVCFFILYLVLFAKIVAFLLSSLSFVRNTLIIVMTTLLLLLFSGFPVQRGRVSLTRHVSWAETACEEVNFPPFSFYPDREVHMQITTNHWNITRRNYIHDATVSWVENVNHENFKVTDTRIVKGTN